jgi:predicted aspartyl protease
MTRPRSLLLAAVLGGAACQSTARPIPQPAAAPAAVQPATQPDVLEQVRAATGGAAWASLHRLHVSSTLRAGGREGRMERWEDVEHGRYAIDTDLPPRDRRQGFDGVSVWTSGDNGVPYALGDEDARLGAIVTSYQVMHGWWFPERRPAARENAGASHEGARAFDLVRITPEAGRPFTLWIDRATHRIDRIVEQEGERQSVTRFADYRQVGALTLPFTIRRGDGDQAHDAVETVTAIELDPAIPDDRFALPPVPAMASGAPITVPFRLERDVILVDVMLDGHGPYEADFDSGGSLVVPPVVVEELHLTPLGSSKQTGGGEGFVMGGVGRVGTLSLGAAVVPRPTFDSFPLFPDSPKRLLMGLETLQRYVVRIDFDTLRMTLTPPASFRYTGDGAIVPFVFQDNQPLITGTVDGIAGTFAVDTGADGSLLLMAPFAKRHGLIERYHATVSRSGMAIGPTSSRLTRVSKVSLNGADGRPVASVERPLTDISTQTTGYDAHRYIAGILGVGILHRFNVTFDYARQRIILERNSHYAEPDIYSRTGLRLTKGPAGLVVGVVMPDSPAVDVKLEAGEVITAINGTSATAFERAALNKLFKGPVGTKITLRVRGKAGERDVALVLRDVL